ncbi:Rho GTPase activating protein [Emydomyces testavorans]|uniref:Rho GTPase activating protein n=1 Tax=Emydomyces testavorans TaxID=2070801 RepID=A0AAF0DP72_9EURO|nr:Rho GTPase activating protein [Emydomyces testavorans]
MAESTGHRTVPRTSSIDSAISSLSSTSHSHKSSLDSSNVTPADIANLVSTAGSPEAVIIHLLKEKQNAASQNAQLWKLVDKQRTMLLALNKDLERAIKDKERYRKRLKEAQHTPPPPLPSDATRATARKDDSKKDEKSEMGQSVRDTLPSQKTYEAEEVQHDADPGQELRSSPVSMHQAVDSDAQTSADLNPDVSSPATDSSENKDSLETMGSISQDAASERNHSSQDTVQRIESSTDTDTLNVSEVTRTADMPRKISTPARKPPPAPLNLDEAQKVRPHILLDPRQASSDSEYDDILEANEIPSIERGRRKTREEDDRLREAMMLKEQEVRSQSGKKKLKHFEPPESVQKEQAHAFPGVGLPASPRAGISGSPSPRLAAMHSPPPASLSAVLQSGSSDPSGSDRSRITSPLSPGLPNSPRPEDRPVGSLMPRFPRNPTSLASPPISPRTVGHSELQNMSNTVVAAQLTPGDDTKEKEEQPMKANTEESNNNIPVYKLTVDEGSPTSVRKPSHTINREMVSAEYPDLLLPPSSLPSIDVKVSSSRLRPSRSSYLALRPTEEEPVFTLSVYSRTNRIELWRVEKAIIALPQLDQQIKQLTNFSAKLPERSIFSGHSPAKVDARRAALNTYFESLLTHPMDEAAALLVCQFLTADAIEPRDDESNLLHGPGNGKPPISFGPDGKPRMEGYLTKRGKNFGGWKSRYFVLTGPELKYYESPGGPHLGTIKIQNAQIGKQSPSGKNQSPSRAEDDSDNQYRHAFLILEPKKRDSSALVRHVLCAESDEERDAWVETLLCYVEPRDLDDEFHGHAQAQKPPSTVPSRSRLHPAHPRKGSLEGSQQGVVDTLQALSYDDVVAAEAPVRVLGGGKVSPPDSSMADHSGRHFEQDNPSPPYKNISGPTNGMKIHNAGAWGNKTVTSTKEKKRSIWGFRATAADLVNQGLRQDTIIAAYDLPVERRGPVRPVFGLPLADAVEFCGPRGLDCGLPAVVYRCLEYLRGQHAELEEGIFRLSGSNVVIKALKERFNIEGDLDFSDGDRYYDVHAVASLFKQYLRELPTTVLTKELHLDFIRVLDLDEKQQKVIAFHSLVRRLPRPNFNLLKVLSQFLLVIINNADVNKMTVRNVGIVFAPTLNMPAPVFSMLLTEFDAIFGDNPPAEFTTRPVELLEQSHRLNPEDIRSPRHQMFSDLPTPSYDQNSFELHRTEPGEDPKHREIRENYNTAFIPMHPTYEPPPVPHQSHEEANLSQLHSMNGLLAPGMQTTKSKRRESSFVFMDMGK